jgi:sigma-B regulation protein RsbU (phosphoserine phosphatase)
MLTRVAIADVVGHGEAASNVAQWLYESLQSSINSPDGDEVLVRLNRLSNTHGLTALTTASVAGFYRANRKLYVSAAGHPPLLLKRKDSTCWEEVLLPKGRRQANLPLGVHEGVQYDQESRELQSGDRLFLYTDGVLEAPNGKRDLFGMERLKRALDESPALSPSEVKHAVLASLNEHTGGHLGHDDVTFMALEVN